MKSEKIYRVGIFFVDSVKEELIKRLHELGIVEIKEAELNNKYETNKDISLLSTLDYELQTIKPGNKIVENVDYHEVLNKAKKLKELYKANKILNDEKKKLLDMLEDGELVLSYIEYDKLPKGWKLIAFEIDRKDLKVQEGWEVYKLPNNKMLVFILTDKEVKLPEKAEQIYTPKNREELDIIRNRLKELNSKIRQNEEDIYKIENDPYIKDVKFTINVLLDREYAYKMLGKGRGYGLLECYVPERFLNNLISNLNNEFKDNIYIVSEVLEKSPVVYIDNPKFVKPVESISYSFGGIPNYKDIDPTLFYYIFFPIMFGFIVGDVVYGVIIMLLASYIQNKLKTEKLKSMARLWFMGGVWSLIFGFVFNEFAGFELLGFTLFHRGDHVVEYISFSLAIGYLHITLGYIINIIKHLSPKPDLHHIFSSIAWLILLNVIALFLLGFFYDWMYLLIALSIIILYKEEGIIGIIELPSIISNLISYIRLAILGIVGVILAGLINSFFKLELLSLLFFIIFHLLHIALIMLEGTIQAGRLNLVEFRTKFFQGGGRFLNLFSINKLKGE